MQLATILNTTSLSTLQEVRNELLEQYQSLTPKERANGFARFVNANGTYAKTRHILRYFRGATRREFDFDRARDKAVRNGILLASNHSVPMVDALAQGMVLALADYGLKVDAYGLLRSVEKKLRHVGVV